MFKAKPMFRVTPKSAQHHKIWAFA